MTRAAFQGVCALMCVVLLTEAALAQRGRGHGGGGRVGPTISGGGIKSNPGKLTGPTVIKGGPTVIKGGPTVIKGGPTVIKGGPVIVRPGTVIVRPGTVVVRPVVRPVYVPGYGTPYVNPYVNPGVVPAETAVVAAPQQDLRYLRVSNQTGGPLTVFVKMDSGTRQWSFPADTVAYLTIDGERLAASEVLIWGQAGSRSWNQYQEQALVTVDAPYPSESIDTFTFTFNP